MLKGVKILHQSHRLDSCRGGSKYVREKQTTQGEQHPDEKMC